MVLLWLTAFAMVGLGCGGGDGRPRVEDRGAEAPLVRTHRVAPPPGLAGHRYSGRLAAPEDGSLSFRIGGRVEEVRVDVGDRFARGDVVAVLDDEDPTLSAHRARAQVDAAASRLETARRDRTRTRQLYEAGNSSERALDQAENAYETARADLAAARRSLRLARRRVGYAELQAPTAGTVVERLVDPGANVTPGQPILRYGAEGGVEAAFLVPPEVALRLEPGMDTQVTLADDGAGADGDGEGEGALGAVITEVGRAIDPSSPGYPVRVALNDPPEAARPGRSVAVSLTLPEDDVLRVPPEALGEDEDGPYVLRVVTPDEGSGEGQSGPNVATTPGEIRRSRVGLDGVDRLGVRVTEGVSAGDVVVTAGLAALQPGDEVRIRKGDD